MGLLSDPEYGSVKWVNILKKVHKLLCFLCYVGAVVWFFLLGYNDFNNETYFSENALLPGLVTNEFNAEYSAKQFYNEFLTELEAKYSDSNEMPVPWLVGKMSQLHLDVYVHNFTLNYPLGHAQIFTGTNVYGILRAARTASLEALVVTAPYRSLKSHHKGTAAGIALMLAFAQFARPQKYWAKDIIFLVTEHEQLGMQAWLEAYHGINSDAETFYKTLGSFWKPDNSPLDFSRLTENLGLKSDHQKCLDPGRLKGRSGSIQAAINLEIHDPKIKYIEVKVEGLNGQLPNLDLVNLVHKLCVKAGIHHSYKNSYSWVRHRDKMAEWQNNVWTMLGMVSSQIAGVPNGNHGLFHRFGIEAVTLEGRDSNDPAGQPPRVHALTPTNFYRLGIALESILRSLNNLLERFHQSYFFYLLAASNRFISIGQYMPSLCLLCVAILLRALSLWVTIQQDFDEETNKHADKPKRKSSVSEQKSKESDRKPSVSEGNPEEIDRKSSFSEERTNYTEEKSPNYEEITVKETSIEGKVLGAQKEKKMFEGDEKQRRESVSNSSETESKVPGNYERKRSVDKSTQLPRTRARYSSTVLNIGLNYLFVHFIGYAIMNSPLILSKIGTEYFNIPTDESLYYGLFVILLFLIVVTPSLPDIFGQGNITYEEFSLVNILLLIELATLCMCIGMHNFPLGFTIAVFYTPLALFIEVEDVSRKNRFWTYIKRAFCLTLSPLFLITGGMIIYSRVQFPEDTIRETIKRGTEATMKVVTFSVADSLIYGNWLFNVTCSVLLPIYLIFWQIATCKPKVNDVKDRPISKSKVKHHSEEKCQTK